MRKLVVLIFLAGASFAYAQSVAGCAKAVSACALDRAGQLAAASDKLSVASRANPGPAVSAADKAKVQEFVNWSKDSSGKLRALADRGKGAHDEASQKAFIEQAAQMQRDMQRQV